VLCSTRWRAPVATDDDFPEVAVRWRQAVVRADYDLHITRWDRVTMPSPLGPRRVLTLRDVTGIEARPYRRRLRAITMRWIWLVPS
jgi:hypothetical protein